MGRSTADGAPEERAARAPNVKLADVLELCPVIASRSARKRRLLWSDAEGCAVGVARAAQPAGVGATPDEEFVAGPCDSGAETVC